MNDYFMNILLAKQIARTFWTSLSLPRTSRQFLWQRENITFAICLLYLAVQRYLIFYLQSCILRYTGEFPS